MSALLFTSTFSLTQAGFVREAEDKGVTVYRRAGAAAIELAAEGRIEAPPARVRDVLLDYARHPAWVKSLAESRVLAREADSLVVYQRLDLPLLDDRDFTLRVTWGALGDALWTRFVAANHLGPAPRDGVVRVSVHEGEWHLAPIDGGKATLARYHVRLDLAGSLPGWLARGRAGKDVPSLYQGIRAQVRP